MSEVPDDATGTGAAVDRAYGEIRGRIVTGGLGPGSRLREIQLAEEVGVSRTPVREALRRLASEGLVDMLPRRGAVVSTWTHGDLDEIFELRAMLEGYGAELAAGRVTEEVLAELDQLAHTMVELGRSRSDGDLDELAKLNSRFHHLVLRSAGNKRLEVLMGQIIEAPLVSRTFHRYSQQELARSTAHHLEIVAALRAGAPSWAKSVMRTHILAARVVHFGPDGADDGRALGAGDGSDGQG